MTVQPDLCQTSSETTLLVFPRGGSIISEQDLYFSGFAILYFKPISLLNVFILVRAWENDLRRSSARKEDASLLKLLFKMFGLQFSMITVLLFTEVIGRLLMTAVCVLFLLS